MMQEMVVVTINHKEPPYVKPFDIRLNPGDTILFRTDDGTRAVVVIPAVKLFMDVLQKDNYQQFVIDRDSEKPLNISQYATRGWYTFHVFLPDIGQFADNPGNSAPKIIIE